MVEFALVQFKGNHISSFQVIGTKNARLFYTCPTSVKTKESYRGETSQSVIENNTYYGILNFEIKFIPGTNMNRSPTLLKDTKYNYIKIITRS